MTSIVRKAYVMRKSEATIRRMRRNRILALSGAVAAALFVGGAAVLIWQLTKDSDKVVATDTSFTSESISEESTSTAETKPSASLADPDMTTTTSSEAADTSASDSSTDGQSSSDSSTSLSASSSSSSASSSGSDTTTTTTTSATTTTTTAKSSPDGKLESIADLPAGRVISSDKIDTSDLSKYFTSHEIVKDDAVYNRINGKSYRKNDNIGLSSLRYLKMLHVNFNGEYQVGEMIVNKKVASDVMEIFRNLCENKYQIYSMYLIDNFWTGSGSSSDYASIDANNTSAFCYRSATGGGNLSKHALGLAIDLNPQQNPYVTYKDGKPKYSHDNAKDYVQNRSSDTPHVITKSDRAYKLFRAKGWTWGGSWSSPKDYQHFQLS